MGYHLLRMKENQFITLESKQIKQKTPASSRLFRVTVPLGRQTIDEGGRLRVTLQLTGVNPRTKGSLHCSPH